MSDTSSTAQQAPQITTTLKFVRAAFKQGVTGKHNAQCRKIDSERRFALAITWPSSVTRIARAYTNRHRHDEFSLQADIEPNVYRVVGYGKIMIMIDTRLHVVESSRLRALKENRRNVNAWAEGTLVFVSSQYNLPFNLPKELRLGRYDYKVNSTFVDAETGERIDYSALIVLIHNSLFYLPQDQSIAVHNLAAA